MSHTPAPWRIGDAGRTVFGPPNGQPAPQIVAAPDLLSALRECITSPGAHCAVFPRDPDLLFRRLVAINEIAHAAIDRAAA